MKFAAAAVAPVRQQSGTDDMAILSERDLFKQHKYAHRQWTCQILEFIRVVSAA